jgi:hypothetical protein
MEIKSTVYPDFPVFHSIDQAWGSDSNATFTFLPENNSDARMYITGLIPYLQDTQCEHISILRALIEYPQGNLEDIQEKILQSTQEEPGGRQDHKAQTYATKRYTASRTASANTGEAIRTLVPIMSLPRPPS